MQGRCQTADGCQKLKDGKSVGSKGRITMYITEQIYSVNLADYSEYIPEAYCSQIRRGELNAVVVYDELGEEKTFYALYVTGRHNGWLEIVWMYFKAEETCMMDRADFIRFVIRNERSRDDSGLKGAFIENHMDEGGERQRLIFALAGLETSMEKNNIYEFSLSQVGQRETLAKMKKRLECRSLGECEDEELDELDACMQEDDRITPVPLFMDWYEYEPDISKVCFKNGKPVGVILFTQSAEYLVIELAYTADGMSLPVLLANALEDAERIYSPEQKVLVPVVVNKTSEIVEKMVPDAFRGEIVEGAVWF